MLEGIGGVVGVFLIVNGQDFAGTDFDGGGNLRITRLNPDGTPDTGFDGDGVATFDFGGADDHATAGALLANGKIVVLGNVSDGELAGIAITDAASLADALTLLK